MKIGIVNSSTEVTDGQAVAMTKAVQQQVTNDLCPAWGITPVILTVYPTETDVPQDECLLVLLDDSDHADALGYHSESPTGRKYARVFSKPVLSEGGRVLSGSLSVSSVLSHEVLEMVIDPGISTWVDGVAAPQGSCYALEACDPCESDSYAITVDGQDITVSDFVYPDWFDMSALSRKVDHLDKCPGPFLLAPGGYCVVRTGPGSEQSVFSARPTAAWIKSKTFPAARTRRRIHVHQVFPLAGDHT